VQLAKLFGAEVTGVCSTANVELVKSLGADTVVDYTHEDFTERGTRYDVIFDAVAKIPKPNRNKALTAQGRYMSAHDNIGRETVEDLVFLKELAEAGQLKPVIDRTYSWEQIVEAHRYVDTGHKRGNVVITVSHTNKPDKALLWTVGSSPEKRKGFMKGSWT